MSNLSKLSNFNDFMNSFARGTSMKPSTCYLHKMADLIKQMVMQHFNTDLSELTNETPKKIPEIYSFMDKSGNKRYVQLGGGYVHELKKKENVQIGEFPYKATHSGIGFAEDGVVTSLNMGKKKEVRYNFIRNEIKISGFGFEDNKINLNNFSETNKDKVNNIYNKIQNNNELNNLFNVGNYNSLINCYNNYNNNQINFNQNMFMPLYFAYNFYNSYNLYQNNFNAFRSNYQNIYTYNIFNNYKYNNYEDNFTNRFNKTMTNMKNNNLFSATDLTNKNDNIKRSNSINCIHPYNMFNNNGYNNCRNNNCGNNFTNRLNKNVTNMKNNNLFSAKYLNNKNNSMKRNNSTSTISTLI